LLFSGLYETKNQSNYQVKLSTQSEKAIVKVRKETHNHIAFL